MNDEDEKELENIFLHAVHEPAYRPDFLEKLLTANIYCIRYQRVKDTIETQLKEVRDEDYISLKTWDDPEYGHIIPFFTSLEKLRKISSEDDLFICLPCRIFFEMTLGSHLILNPESNAIKEFFPDEIKSILQGDFGQIAESYELETDAEIFITEPEHYPEFMVEQLKQFFLSELHIVAAYLAEIYDPEIDEEPTLMIGLQFDKILSDDYIETLHRKIGQVAYACLENKKTINLIHIDKHEGGINRYFYEEIAPFYIRPQENKDHFFVKLFS